MHDYITTTSRILLSQERAPTVAAEIRTLISHTVRNTQDIIQDITIDIIKILLITQVIISGRGDN